MFILPNEQGLSLKRTPPVFPLPSFPTVRITNSDRWKSNRLLEFSHDYDIHLYNQPSNFPPFAGELAQPNLKHGRASCRSFPCLRASSLSRRCGFKVDYNVEACLSTNGVTRMDYHFSSHCHRRILPIVHIGPSPSYDTLCAYDSPTSLLGMEDVL